MTDQTPTPGSKFKINQFRTIDAHGSWKATSHKLDEKSAYALEAALVTGRPLLVRGEPGIGKSQLARYAADVLGRLFVSEVVNINTEGQDLLWRYDPVARLNDAQLGRVSGSLTAETFPAAIADVEPDSEGAKEGIDNAKESRHEVSLSIGDYLNPGVLWWVYDWASAEMQYRQCKHKMFRPHCDNEAQRKKGMVLLIDEIDKADPSLPNSLLEVFGNGGFYVPMLSQHVGSEQTATVPPLVIITTNEERELPPAFLRRCLVLDLKLDDKDELHEWWQSQDDKETYPETAIENFDADKGLAYWLGQERAEVHYPGVFSDAVKQRVAEYLIEDRLAAEHERTKPGQAEYLDLLRALQEMTIDCAESEREAEHLRLLDKLRPFTLAKG